MSHLRFQCTHRYPDGFELEAAFEADGGTTALFGPSGCGKSTILAIIGGILRPDTGSVQLGEQMLLETARRVDLPANRRQIGFVFQEHRLFPHLSVRKNLRYGLQRQPKHPVDFRRVVESLELGDLLERDPQTLSGGQQQRVALGRAILRGPALLLMDEPWTALDATIKERIMAYWERVIAEFRIPTLLVSHDHADVRRLADRVVVLQDGRVVETGSPEIIGGSG